MVRKILYKCLPLVALLVACLIAPAQAQADDGSFVAAETGVSFLTEWSSGRTSPGTTATGIRAGEETFVRFGGSVALLNDVPGRNMIPDEFGYSAEAGQRWSQWGVFGHLSHNLWAPNRRGWTIEAGVLNAGAGVEYFLFDRRVRLSGSAGTSTLLFDTVFDDAGTTGFFFQIRPAGLRWQISESLRLEWDPIIFSASHPVIEAPTLDKTEFKSILMLEVGL